MKPYIPILLALAGCGGAPFTAGGLLDNSDADTPDVVDTPDAEPPADVGTILKKPRPDGSAPELDADAGPDVVAAEASPPLEASTPEASPPPVCASDIGTWCTTPCDFGSNYCLAAVHDQFGGRLYTCTPLPSTCAGVCPPTCDCILAAGTPPAFQGCAPWSTTAPGQLELEKGQ